VEAVIKVEKFLMKQGIRVGKGAIEFKGEGCCLDGFHLVGFTICDDAQKGMFVMFPMSKTNPANKGGKEEGFTSRNFFFLRPDRPERLDDLQEQILDVYESLENQEFKNRPRLKQANVPAEVV
jgi:hypothetical protein